MQKNNFAFTFLLFIYLRTVCLMTMSGAKAIATDDRKITEKKMEMAVRDLT